MSRNALANAVTGKREYVLQAIDCLIAEGALELDAPRKVVPVPGYVPGTFPQQEGNGNVPRSSSIGERFGARIVKGCSCGLHLPECGLCGGSLSELEWLAHAAGVGRRMAPRAPRARGLSSVGFADRTEGDGRMSDLLLDAKEVAALGYPTATAKRALEDGAAGEARA
jgi:hypothetical protein